MPKSPSITVLLSLALLCGCAHRDRAPGGVIVDMKGVDPVQYQKDLAECGTYADQVNASENVAGRAAGGAVVGGAVGAIFGGGHGAAQGAGAGAVVGGARGVGATVQERNHVVRTCLRNRGYAVLN
jgi:outer membrane lipoprotein SlyB